ncbi:MAG: DUF493 domain-containing protein [Thiothrix sp.]|nr:DUF493 domain-containing protein [Thiothrix sp.]HPE59114.1 DUF493 domain-containing protein [Thiolinea sp.]
MNNEHFGTDPRLQLDFPCDFPIKVAGPAGDEFVDFVSTVAARHDPAFKAEAIGFHQSSRGKYQSLTLGIRATSKEQIDAIYQDLKTSELVLWAL